MRWLLLLTPWAVTYAIVPPGTAPAGWTLICAVLALIGFSKMVGVRKAQRRDREDTTNNR